MYAIVEGHSPPCYKDVFLHCGLVQVLLAVWLVCATPCLYVPLADLLLALPLRVLEGVVQASLGTRLQALHEVVQLRQLCVRQLHKGLAIQGVRNGLCMRAGGPPAGNCDCMRVSGG